jgi:hypothetical protein
MVARLTALWVYKDSFLCHIFELNADLFMCSKVLEGTIRPVKPRQYVTYIETNVHMLPTLLARHWIVYSD